MVFRKKMEKKYNKKLNKMNNSILNDNKSDRKMMPASLFDGRPDEEKNSNFFRTVLMVFALFTTFSLLITGCSSSAPTNTQTTTSSGSGNSNTVNAGGVAPLNESKNVSMDTNNQSEIQKTHDKIVQLIADGSYDDTVTYFTHVGQESVEIKVATAGDIVTSASVTPVSADRTSTNYISAFNSALPSLVVGKKIGDISIPHTVSGSSLTSAAFANHLKDLIAQHPG